MSQTNPFTESQAPSAADDSRAVASAAAAAPAASAPVTRSAPVSGGGYGAVSASTDATTGGENEAYRSRPDPEVDGPGAAYREKSTTAAAGGDADVKAPAPEDDKTTNALFLVLAFLSWVGCWVVFTGRLASFYTGQYSVPSATCQLYWNQMVCVSSSSADQSWSWTYADCTDLLGWHMQNVCDACLPSGKGSLAMAIFAFFFLTTLLVLLIARVIGREASIPYFGADKGRYFRAESILTGASLFCFWIVVMLFRTKCIEEAQDWNQNWGSVVVASGWWYVLATFFFLIVSMILSLSYRANPFCKNRCRDTLAEQQTVIAAANAGPAAGCVDGFRNSPAFATRCDSVLNVIVLICIFLCWVGAANVIGGELHRTTLQVPNGITIHYGWNSFSAGSISETYADCSTNTGTATVLTDDQCDSCKTGGRGTVGVASLAFIADLIALVFILLRFSGKVKATLLRAEYVLSIFAAICFLFVSIVWGGTCFNSVNQGSATGLPTTQVGTGWAYAIFCFLLSLLNIFLFWIIRHRASDLPSLETGGVYSSVSDENGV